MATDAVCQSCKSLSVKAVGDLCRYCFDHIGGHPFDPRCHLCQRDVVEAVNRAQSWYQAKSQVPTIVGKVVPR
jgi:hypothetical protein